VAETQAVVPAGRLRLGAAAVLVAALMPSTSLAQPAYEGAGEPKWEAGLAFGGGSINDYPGADQNHARAIVTPLLIYRGRVLRIDREGVRGRLFNNRDFELDLAASAWFDARDSRAREGMPGLDYLFGLGPQLVYKGLSEHWGHPILHLKARALVSTDFRDVHGRGVALDPEVRWQFSPAGLPRGTLTLGVQPTWASRPLMRYFYEVEPGQATPERPAYHARAGYLGTELNLLFTRRESASLTWFATARGMLLNGAANAASPLLRDKSTLSIGAGVLWTPWQSRARAAD
jgi:outer membrane scaffolding protein for murein synthesis (MipA/OmpV family)